MANYIKQLQEKKAELLDVIDDGADLCTELMRYLSSDKFNGVENNFVNASEMFQRVLEIRNHLNRRDPFTKK